MTPPITYTQYAEWANRNNITPYTPKQWETLTPIHVYGITLAVRRNTTGANQ